MRSVKIKELKSGLILARDVEDAAGNRLLTVGTTLSKGHMALLEGWRIAEVWVEDAVTAVAEAPAEPETPATKDAGEEALAEAKKRLAARFEGRERNAWMKALHEEAAKRLAAPRFWNPGENA